MGPWDGVGDAGEGANRAWEVGVGVRIYLPCAIKDGVEAMGNGQDGAVGELLPDGLLNESVRLEVNRRLKMFTLYSVLRSPWATTRKRFRTVASSRTRTFVFRSIARAKQMSWRWPTL